MHPRGTVSLLRSGSARRASHPSAYASPAGRLQHCTARHETCRTQSGTASHLTCHTKQFGYFSQHFVLQAEGTFRKALMVRSITLLFIAI